MKKIELIDFLKGYSIFTIIIFHYCQFLEFPQPYDKLIFFGGTGIHLFILLSGLGLYLSFLNCPLEYGTFLRKRMGKIYFPYVFIVLLSAAVSLIIPVYQNNLYALGGHLLLYKMFDESIMGSYGYQLWFVSMIIQFYLVFHILVWAKKHISKNVSFILIATFISIAWAIYITSIGKSGLRIWNSFFLQYLWEFCLGMVLGKMIFEGKTFTQYTKKYRLLVLGVLCCTFYAALALTPGGYGKLFNDIPALIGYSCIAIFVYLLKNNSLNSFFLYTGKISFSLFLTHFLTLKILAYAFGDIISHWIIALVTIPITYLFSNYYQKFTNKIVSYIMQGNLSKKTSLKTS